MEVHEHTVACCFAFVQRHLALSLACPYLSWALQVQWLYHAGKGSPMCAICLPLQYYLKLLVSRVIGALALPCICDILRDSLILAMKHGLLLICPATSPLRHPCKLGMCSYSSCHCSEAWPPADLTQH